jgi:hypothetical protein
MNQGRSINVSPENRRASGVSVLRDTGRQSTSEIRANMIAADASPLSGYGEQLADQVCEPGHRFITGITTLLFSNGIRDLQMDEAGLPDYLDVVIRGATGIDLFTMLLSNLGKFILHLCFVRSWYLIDRDRDVADIRRELFFGLNNHGSGETTINPPPDSFPIAMEWWWVSRFLGMATRIDENDINAIPFMSQPIHAPGEADQDWLNERHRLKEKSEKWPYMLTKMELAGELPQIIAIPNARMKPDELKDTTLAHLSELEFELSLMMQQISLLWSKLASPSSAQDREANELLHNIMLSQLQVWDKAVMKDPELMGAISTRAFIQDWTNPTEKERMRALQDALNRASKESCNYGKGYCERPKMHLDPAATEAIEALIPDLRGFMATAWPITDEKNQQKLLKESSFTNLSPRDWNMVWSPYQERYDRKGFCAAVVQKYLERTTGHSYGLKPIQEHIDGFLKKIEKSKRPTSPYSRRNRPR